MPQAEHPTARILRDLCAQERFRDVESLLDEALRAEPNHPELLTEQARFFLYRGREQDALKSILGLPVNENSTEVAQHLANHLGCRLSIVKKDQAATEGLRKLAATYGVEPEANTGITISACLIVKNEEAHLDKCLASLTGIVDQIVVVDTGSTDRTVEIAQKHGATIGAFPWTNDFSAARNASLELATGHWILWIDADEVLQPTSKRAFLNGIQRPQFGGFSVEIVNFTADGNDTTQYVHAPIRLFRNLPSVRFTGRIHEQICDSLRALRLPGAILDGAQILHYGYRPSEMEAKGKLTRTLELLQQEVLDRPDEPFHWFNLCNALFVAERWAEAEHAGRQCARYLKDGDPYGALNYQLLIGSLAAQNKVMPALRVCDEAAARGFGGLLIDFERANVHLRANEPELALQAIDRCMAAEWSDGMTGDRSIHLYKRHIVRGQVLAVLGQFEEALRMFDYALAIVPDHGSALYSRAATLERTGEWPAAREAFLAGRQDPAVRHLCTKGCARVALTMGLAEEACSMFQEAWEADPNDYDCWVGWTEAASAWGNPTMVVTAYEAFVQRHEPTPDILVNWGRALQAVGQNERAMSLYTEALQRDPNNPNAYFNCGDLLYATGQYHDAAHIYEAGLRHAPGHADGWFVLGNCLAKLNIEDGAVLAFKQALLLNPQHQAATFNLECLAA